MPTYGEGNEVLIDKDGHQYTKDSILKGIKLFSNIAGSGFGGIDSAGGNIESYSVGSGSRLTIIRALGFSDNPSKAECDKAMSTIVINAYPDKKICVHKNLVNEVQNIFNDLKAAGVKLNNYIGGYCFRPINNPTKKGSKTLSMHSFGCAIDINYNINGFVGGGRPLSSGDDTAAGKIRTLNSPIVKIFAKYGWGWGGRYGDYMHFSKANGG